MSQSQTLKEKFFRLGKVADCPVYDLHGHMGPLQGAHMIRPEPAQMVAAMDHAGVRMLVFCYHSTLFSPDLGNRPNIEAVRAFPDRLRAYCGVNPNYPQLVQREAETFDQYRDVYVGFKLLADYHRLPVTHDHYQPAWERANAEGLLCLLHTWGSSAQDGPDQVRAVAEKYPRARILLGHSCHGEWNKAAALTRDFPNVYLELTAVPDERGPLETLAEKAGSRRLIFGTDYPWFDYHYYIGAVLGAGLSDDDCRNILYRNAEGLLGITPPTP